MRIWKGWHTLALIGFAAACGSPDPASTNTSTFGTSTGGTTGMVGTSTSDGVSAGLDGSAGSATTGVEAGAVGVGGASSTSTTTGATNTAAGGSNGSLQDTSSSSTTMGGSTGSTDSVAVGGSSTVSGMGGSSTVSGMGGSSTSSGAGGSSTNTSASTTGGMAACESGALDAPLPNCSPEPVPDTGDYYADCVARINQFRWECQCLPPLERWVEAESCADQQAQYDYQQGSAHQGISDNICSPGGNAQNECPDYGPNFGIVDFCLQQMWDEGPGADFNSHGHYINMSNTSFTRVACGMYVTPSGNVWAVQNFQ